MGGMQAKTNKQVAGVDSNLGDDNSGNPQEYFNTTNERLERLESESRSLQDEIRNLQQTTSDISETELRVSAAM